jgi:mRNA interferase RelE/StbE
LHNVHWSEGAISDLQDLDKPIAARILKKITWLGNHFEDIVPEPLSGLLGGAYKYRVGDWRVIYTLMEDAIIIQAVGHRRNIYRQ